MKKRLPLFDRLRVRTPCDVGWSNMEDEGRDRHCARCEMTVHDVASMTRVEVEALLEKRLRGERVCLHLHVRRSDGAVLVADGHVERGGMMRPPSRMIAAAVATATAMTACTPVVSPPEAPHTEIAVGVTTAPPIDTRPPEPPPIAPAAPPPETASAPAMPEPTRPTSPAPAKVTHPKKIDLTKKAPPNKHAYSLIDGDAW